MNSRLRRALEVALVAFLAALAGVLIGRSLADPDHSASTTIHDLLHDKLALDASQLRQIDQLETLFAARRRALELELRAENARLAAAIETEHGFGPRVAAEVQRTHATMGALQNETLAHIFAMRAVLRPDQAKEFDRVVFETLTNAQ